MITVLLNVIQSIVHFIRECWVRGSLKRIAMGESFLAESRVRRPDYPSAELMTRGDDPGPALTVNGKRDVSNGHIRREWRTHHAKRL